MKISLLGTGLMGFPMAQRLLDHGNDLSVFNRTAEKAVPLEDAGAHVVGSAREAIENSPASILVLSDYKAIEETLFPQCCELLKDKTIIQMGTIAPSESRELHQRLTDRGADYLECPVLGSRTEASQGELILMVGATKAQFNEWQGLLEVFGPNPRHVGQVGQAAALKLALNHLIAAHAASFSLSLGLIEKNDVDVELFMDVLRNSSLYAPMFDKKLPNWTKRAYEDPNFPTKHMLKDIELIHQEAKKQGMDLSALEGIRKIFRKAGKQGLNEKDYSSVFNIINAL